MASVRNSEQFIYIFMPAKKKKKASQWDKAGGLVEDKGVTVVPNKTI